MAQLQPTRRSGGGKAALTAEAIQLADWFRQLDRLVRTSRTYGPTNELVIQSRDRLLHSFNGLLTEHGPIALHVTATDITWRDEPVVAAPRRAEEGPSLDRRIPFLLYRDGVRGLGFGADTPPADVSALLAALIRVAASGSGSEDIVTLLWEANLEGLRVEVAPIEQVIATRTSGTQAPGDELLASLDLSAERLPSGSAQAMTSRHFDDWDPADPGGDPEAAWADLSAGEARARADWRARWERERGAAWTTRVPELVRATLAGDNGPAVREALGHAVVTWLANAFERCDWPEAWRALECLREIDSGGTHTAEALAGMLSGVDAVAVTERLDESDAESQARFFALTVGLGSPALDLVVGVLAHSVRPRLRAAGTTALSYTCADDPRPLARYLADSRWHVVRNIVFVLGQIGGESVVEFLSLAARHLDVRVRRAVIAALGQIPAERRLPLLLEQLDTSDTQMLHSVLAMLGRHADRRVARALLGRVSAVDFESRSEEVKLALLAAVADAADDDAVPALELMLCKGGWFAKRSIERSAAAHTLARIGTPMSLAILQDGLRSRSEAVRTACREALALRKKAA